MNCIRCKQECPEGAVYCPWCGKRQDGAPPPQRKKRRRPRGEGSVFKKNDCNRNRPFIAVVKSESGKKVQLGSFATAGEAVRALDTYNAQKTPAARLKYTFADVYSKWSVIHFKKVGVKGKEGYERAFSKAERLHKREMRTLKAEDYQSVIDELAAAGKSRSLCEKQRQLFSQMCQWAMKQDIITQNYAERLSLPEAPARKERILTLDEIERIKAVAESKEKGNRLRKTAQMSLVLLYTGMRINELLTVKRDNVDIAAGFIVGGEKTEAGRNRIIPILSPIKPILAEWMLDSMGEELLLPDRNGRKRDTNTVEHAFKSLMLQCGINTPDMPKELKVTPHTLRRTAATLLVEAGAEPTAVKTILGHSDFSTTVDYYTIHSREYLASEMQKLAEKMALKSE